MYVSFSTRNEQLRDGKRCKKTHEMEEQGQGDAAEMLSAMQARVPVSIPVPEYSP